MPDRVTSTDMASSPVRMTENHFGFVARTASMTSGLRSFLALEGPKVLVYTGGGVLIAML